MSDDDFDNEYSPSNQGQDEYDIYVTSDEEEEQPEKCDACNQKIINNNYYKCKCDRSYVYCSNCKSIGYLHNCTIPTKLQIKVDGREDDKKDIEQFKKIIKDVFECGGYDGAEFNILEMNGTFDKYQIFPLISHVHQEVQSSSRLGRWVMLDCKMGIDSVEVVFGTHPDA